MIGPVIFPRKSTEIAHALDDFFFQCVYYGPTSDLWIGDVGSRVTDFERRSSSTTKRPWDPM